MTPRFRCITSIVSSLLLALGANAAVSAGQPVSRPNIVFILADDLGYMDIGANNPKTFYETPHIDAMARRGGAARDAVYARLRGVPGLLADAREHHDRQVPAARGHHRLHRR